MKKLFLIFSLSVLLASCVWWWSWLSQADRFSKEICNDLWYDKVVTTKVKEDKYGGEKLMRYKVDCYEKVTDEEPVKTLEISDFKYYEKAKWLCKIDGFSSVSNIVRNIDQTSKEVLSQRVDCHNKSLKDWFSINTTELDQTSSQIKKLK